MSVQITGFTKTTTSPFQDVSGTNYYAGLSGTTPGPTYYNIGNLYIFQDFSINNTATGSIIIPSKYDASVKYYLVGGGGGGGLGLNAGGNGGGHGGNYVFNQFSISGSKTITLSIGAGGIGASGQNPKGTDGGNTNITYLSNTINASGGPGGGGLNSPLTTVGSQFTDSLGNIYYYGSGGGGDNNYSGSFPGAGGWGCGYKGGARDTYGGGGGGGTQSAGVNGSTNNGGAGGASNGGAGGVGTPGNAIGSPGGFGGGGGGGCGALNFVGLCSGGAGGIGGGGGGGGAGGQAYSGNGGDGGVGGGGGGGASNSKGGNGGINGGGGGGYGGLEGNGTGGNGGVGLVVLEITLTPTPISNICFLGNTPISTDQGKIPIEKINTSIHTIHNKPITAITKTITEDEYLVCFEKHSLSLNIPSKKTIMSKNHKVYYKGIWREAQDFIDEFDNIYETPYNGEILYNILLEKHDKVYVNNLVCETLHPKNNIAKLYTSNFNEDYRDTIIVMMNDSILSNDFQLYNKVIELLSGNDNDDAYEDLYEDGYAMEKFEQNHSPLKSTKIQKIILDNTTIQNKLDKYIKSQKQIENNENIQKDGLENNLQKIKVAFNSSNNITLQNKLDKYINNKSKEIKEMEEQGIIKKKAFLNKTREEKEEKDETDKLKREIRNMFRNTEITKSKTYKSKMYRNNSTKRFYM
jgi:hypothetical protein